MLEQTRFGTRKTVHRQFDEVVQRTKRALADHSFRLISEADLGTQLESDASDARKYMVLSAWNALSSAAAQKDPEVGGLLSCDVVIYEQSSGQCVVSAVDPLCALELVGPDMLIEQSVLDSREKLQRVIESV